ncbi:hypothetical protein F5Y11DRAFT_330886 [Daldinia sp. FL1419]|nr:hypothetical protein F5Y11DRAFT_330886 [Daldinia sp. FL1419]
MGANQSAVVELDSTNSSRRFQDMNGKSGTPIEIPDSSSSAGNEEEEHGLKGVKANLLNCLDKIQTTGHVAASKQYGAFTNPGLTVAGTLIPLPLMSRDAETIRSVSRQAPFGKGDETVVDTSVRKTWELDHTQFAFANPAWQGYVALVLREAAQSLAMSEVRAEPYKLLLYDEGSFFKRHKDSEKVPGMIGTLVICLPSKHDGGSVHLSHVGKSYVFDTDKTSDFGLTSLSWFSDVTHEIKPLKSGYRLVLTYNIIHTGHKQLSARLVEKQSERLRSVLVKWQSELRPREKLVYQLEHKYTKSSLMLSNLKGRDRAVCQTLYEVGLDCGFVIFLAEMTRTQDDSEGYCETDEASTELDDVRTCEGLIVCGRISLDDQDILGSDLWARDADSEDEGDFTGNESMPSTLRYHDTVVVIVPMSKMPSFISSPDPRAVLSLVNNALEHRPGDRRLQASLLTILESSVPQGWSDGAFLSNVVALAIKLQRKTLYTVAVRTSFRGPVPRQLVLATLVRHMKEDHLRDPQKQPDWDRWFSDVISRATKISLVVLDDVLNSLDASIQEESLKESFRTWKTPLTTKMVESKDFLGVEDHDYLIGLLFNHSNDLEWLTNWFAPVLSGKGTKALICSILGDIHSNRERKTLARATDAYRCILESSAKKLVLTSGFPSPGNRYVMIETATSFYRKIIELVSQSLDMGLSKQAIGLLETSCADTDRDYQEPDEWDPLPAVIIQEFMEALLKLFRKYNIPPPESTKAMFISIFRNLFIGELPMRPTKPQGWRHKPIQCYENCADCRVLNSFLVNHQEQTREFAVPTKRRQHLESLLSRSLFRCHTRTGRLPYGLVVTKLGNEFQEDMREYEAQLEAVRNRLRPFRREDVKSLLGEGLYQELVLLKCVSDVDNAGTTTPGQKRKAEEEPDGSSASRPRLIE